MKRPCYTVFLYTYTDLIKWRQIFMRIIEFKMERPGLLNVGDEIDVEESQLQTLQGIIYYYTIYPALAMSNNIPARNKLKNFHGKVVDIKATESAAFVYGEFEE